MKSLTICHLYPDVMNTYGDRGNVIALVKRLEWRGIKATVVEVGLGQELPKQTVDIYFFGGGQDQAQISVAQDLVRHRTRLFHDIDDGAVMLAICGGYQLLGASYTDDQGRVTRGLGLFDCITTVGKKRLVGNIQIKLKQMVPGLSVVGFENHSGLTTLGETAQPLAKVVQGFGNNGRDGTEGIVFKNAIGCYMHGSLLPKNPQLTDALLKLAMSRKYPDFEFEPLDDSLERAAYRETLGRF